MRLLLYCMIITALFSCKKTDIDNLLWYEQFLVTGGGRNSDALADMDADQAGNLYLTGYVGELFTYDSAWFGNKVFTGLKQRDVVTLKYNKNGTLLWGRVDGSISSESGTAIIADEQGNCYLAGYFGDTIHFDNDVLHLTWITNPTGAAGLNEWDMFLVKLNTQGKVSWSRKVSGFGFESPSAMIIDQMGNIIIAGRYSTDIRYDNTILYATGEACFVASFTPSGDLNWLKSIGSGVPG